MRHTADFKVHSIDDSGHVTFADGAQGVVQAAELVHVVDPLSVLRYAKIEFEISQAEMKNWHLGDVFTVQISDQGDLHSDGSVRMGKL